MYEEDRENREDRDQEIERTEIMDDVDEQETQTRLRASTLGDGYDLQDVLSAIEGTLAAGR